MFHVTYFTAQGSLDHEFNLIEEIMKIDIS